MKVLILAELTASHTIRWVNALDERGLDIFLFGINKYNGALYNKNVKIECINVPEIIKNTSSGNFSKIVYLKALKNIKRILNEFKPDILHAHYASSFGILGALTGFHPFIISVWGSDIFSFPDSKIRKLILKFSLSKADKILSTSRIMKEEVKKYIEKDITLTPFGVDIRKFSPQKNGSIFDKNDIVIGTVKTLMKNYGIEYLIRAFYILKNKYSAMSLKLLIVGEGNQREYLENLVKRLGLIKDTVFTGYINPNEVAYYHNQLDIYVAVSIKESFGVAVLEASACSKPVVVSNVGGLPEVVDDEQTGYIIEKENPAALAAALEKLILDPELRFRMGKNGREKVIREFDWNNSVNRMISIYESLVIKN